MDLDVETPDVTLTTPVYNVTHIKLISARVPNSQLLINQYNNTYVYQANTYSIPFGTYTTGEDLANAFTGPVTAVYHSNTNSLTFNDEFQPGSWLSNILGYPGGVVNLSGPQYITIRLTIGGDVLSRTVYQRDTDCHYLGKMLTGPIGETIRYTDSFDTIQMDTQIKTIQTMHFDFLNPDGSTYNFGGQGYILKFRLTCSTDKLSVIKGDTVVVDDEELPGPSRINWFSDRFLIVAAAIVILTLGLFFLMRQQVPTA